MKLNSFDINKIIENVENNTNNYNKSNDKTYIDNLEIDKHKKFEETYITAGQSRRIWNELYKVVDSSDVVLQVLDSRDPMGTRSLIIENYIKKNCPYKHIVFVLNKTDLVPSPIVTKWIK